MSSAIFAGIFLMGFVFGYLLCYAVRHTQEFKIDLLSSAIGAVDGGFVVAVLGRRGGWIGPYGLGTGVGFLFYLVLSPVLIFAGKFERVSSSGVMIANRPGIGLLSKTLLSVPRRE